MANAASPLDTTALLAAIVESSDDAIISKTLDGVITSWNAGAQRIFGYTPEEAIGQPITKILIPDDRLDEEEDILERLRRGERVDHFATVRKTKSGRLIDDSVTISPIRNAAGVAVGASKVARDITLQKRAQRELEEADMRKNEFIALLAHELRNPLGPIRHAAKIRRARAPSPDELAWATSIIDRQAEHMSRLVEDLLDVSRITRGTIELRRERVDITTILKAAIEASTPLIDRLHHRLKVSLPRQPLFVNGDPARLTQVVTNLLDKAAKYTDAGGHITVSADYEDGMAVIRVQDTGIGIPSEVLPRIFDMFTQAGMSLERGDGDGVQPRRGSWQRVPRPAPRGRLAAVRAAATRGACRAQLGSALPRARGGRQRGLGGQSRHAARDDGARSPHRERRRPRARSRAGVSSRSRDSRHRPAENERLRAGLAAPRAALGQGRRAGRADRLGTGRAPPPLRGIGLQSSLDEARRARHAGADPRRRRPLHRCALSAATRYLSRSMTHTTAVALPPAEVLARAQRFFAERIPAQAAFVEKRGPSFLGLRGQGGEEVVISVWEDQGQTRVRASTLFFDQAIDRFFSTLPLAAAVEVA